MDLGGVDYGMGDECEICLEIDDCQLLIGGKSWLEAASAVVSCIEDGTFTTICVLLGDQGYTNMFMIVSI